MSNLLRVNYCLWGMSHKINHIFNKRVDVKLEFEEYSVGSLSLCSKRLSR